MKLVVKNLKGSPDIVKSTFDVSSNELESLEGAPKIIGGKFMCSFNKLKNLIGFPESVEGNVMLNMNYTLTSLEGIGQVKNKLFLLGCPVRDLSPLKNNKEPITVVTDAEDVKTYINVPPQVTLMQSDNM